MTVTISITGKCNKCSRTITAEKTIGNLAVAMKKAGWKFVNAKEQLCPDHAGTTKAKVGKKTVKKVVKEPAGKKATVKKTMARVLNYSPKPAPTPTVEE